MQIGALDVEVVVEAMGPPILRCQGRACGVESNIQPEELSHLAHYLMREAEKLRAATSKD